MNFVHPALGVALYSSPATMILTFSSPSSLASTVKSFNFIGSSSVTVPSAITISVLPTVAYTVLPIFTFVKVILSPYW